MVSCIDVESGGGGARSTNRRMGWRRAGGFRTERKLRCPARDLPIFCVHAPPPPHERLHDPPALADISVRLDRDVLARFRATGAGWQSRMNEALREAAP